MADTAAHIEHHGEFLLGDGLEVGFFDAHVERDEGRDEVALNPEQGLFAGSSWCFPKQARPFWIAWNQPLKARQSCSL